MKYLKQFTSIFLTVIVANMVFVPPAYAAPGDLVVEFEASPLFSEANFLPGDAITRFANVKNNSGTTKKIAVEAINESDPDGLGDKLRIKITEGATEHYNDTLAQFFADGELFLSSLAGGGTQTQYDFTISFISSAPDSYQEKSLGFDILIGFQGEGGGINAASDGSGGGGGGGGLIQGLVIKDEGAVSVEETSATIEWLTSFFATSQVVYSAENEPHLLDLTDTSGTPPRYGYAHTTPEIDTSPRVTFHSVAISGLTPGTTYFYRVISHASPATISREFSFTTKGASVTERIPFGASPSIPQGEIAGTTKESLPPVIKTAQAAPRAGAFFKTEGAGETPLPAEEKITPKEGEEPSSPQGISKREKSPTPSLNSIGAFLGGLRELDRFERLLLFLFIILVIWLISRWWNFWEK